MAMNKNSRGSAEVNIAETVFTAEQLVMYARFTNQSTQTVFLEEEVVRVLEFTYVLYDIPLPTITNIEFIDHEEQLTMNIRCFDRICQNCLLGRRGCQDFGIYFCVSWYNTAACN